ncbi:NACHT and WD domain protein [Colletotrichum tofieldiae]|nr:NACHT and WD domain protein [Colletotrichum tofieldiae]
MEKISEFGRISAPVIELARGATQATGSPYATIAWVGVSFALEILANPFTESRVNRKGITHVLLMMNWYWNLAALLLDQNAVTAPAQGSLDQLEGQIVELYRELLIYQMKSVCRYYRNQVLTFFRDVVKLDDWAGRLDGIIDAERKVRAYSNDLNILSIRSHLGTLIDTAEKKLKKLDGVQGAIEESSRREEERKEDSVNERCLVDLCETDPRDHKENIIWVEKETPLQDSYGWILNNGKFQSWSKKTQGVLWINGDPGKGKTMLLCGIIDELEKDPTNGLSYFFCRATDRKLNNATAVLRGLIYRLADQYPQLICHVRKRYHNSGKRKFEEYAWVVMLQILRDILQHPSLGSLILVVDALDECDTDLPKLLDFIIETSSSFKVKWIISSRKRADIEEKLKRTPQLELTHEIICHAVTAYISKKVEQLALNRGYNVKTQQYIKEVFEEKSGNTFLWVALVCKELAGMNVFEDDVAGILEDFPDGLGKLYEQMMGRITREKRRADKCKRILAVTSVAYCSLTLSNLSYLLELLNGSTDDTETLKRDISFCGSLLTIRDGSVHFVHQSAKEYVQKTAYQIVSPFTVAHQHHLLFSRSLRALRRTLSRDIYSLRAAGTLMSQITPLSPSPLEPLEYSCVYWVDHLFDSLSEESGPCADMKDHGYIHGFLETKLLPWLEALSLLHSMPQAVSAVHKLKVLAARSGSPLLTALLRDAHRFVLFHGANIEIAPLQVYDSGLVFIPKRSVVRERFQGDAPDWIFKMSDMEPTWNPCLQTLSGHEGFVWRVAFSTDGLWLASVSADETVKIWDSASGRCLKTLNYRRFEVENKHRIRGGGKLSGHSLVFSSDGLTLVFTSETGEIWAWDWFKDKRPLTIDKHMEGKTSLATLSNRFKIAAASSDGTAKIWDPEKAMFVHILRDQGSAVRAIAFLSGELELATISDDKTVEVWDAVTGDCVRAWSLGEPYRPLSSVAFSGDGRWLASADGTVRLWDVSTGMSLWKFPESGVISALAFSTDNRQLASVHRDDVTLWATETWVCTSKIRMSGQNIRSIAFSPDSGNLVSASADGTIKVWDLSTFSDTSQGTQAHAVENFQSEVCLVAISSNGETFATCARTGTIEIWDTVTGQRVHAFSGNRGLFTAVEFSRDNERLASASFNGTIDIWNTRTGVHEHRINYEDTAVYSVAFLTDTCVVASGFAGIKKWDLANGKNAETLDESKAISNMALSPDHRWLAYVSRQKRVKVQDITTSKTVPAISEHGSEVLSLAFSADSQIFATASSSEIRIWDPVSVNCLQIIKDGVGSGFALAFDLSIGTRLHTQRGFLDLDLTSAKSLPEHLKEEPCYHGYGISSDATWILQDGDRVLWLPEEYRPRLDLKKTFTPVINGSTLGWESQSKGSVWMHMQSKQLTRLQVAV